MRDDKLYNFTNEVLPVYNENITVKGNYRTAVLLHEGKELAVQVDNENRKVSIPRLDIHGMVVFSK